MKKIITAAIVTGLLSSSVAYGVIVNQPQEIKPIEEKKVVVITPSVTPDPEPVSIKEPTPSTQKVAPAPSPKEIPKIPTLAELETKYGWNRMAGGIQEYVNRWPQYFTEIEREAAFKYIYDNGLAYCNKLGIPVDNSNHYITVNYCWTKLLQKGIGDQTIDLWIRIGKAMGLDTSRYE